jgi:alkylation response protein AidB-like acyl-CoA dehydrogenase
MEFAFNTDQRELSGVLRAALERDAPVSRWLSAGFDPADDPAWRLLARDLQALAPDVPEELGGLGLTPVELTIVAEEAGRVVAPAAFTASVGIAQSILLAAVRAGAARADGAAVRTALAQAAGGTRYAVTDELTAGGEASGQLTLSPAGRVSGRAAVPAGAAGAQRLLVLAATPAGPVLADVAAAATGITPAAGIDPAAGAALADFDDVPAVVLLSPGQTGVTAGVTAGITAGVTAGGIAAAGRDRARLVVAAQALGGARACLDMTVRYAGQRVQFDVPIGSFQAVKHRLASLFVETELAASAVYLAACQQSDGSQAELATLAALDTATTVFVRAARDCIQLHGGIGFTWEYPAHLYLTRALFLSSLLGSERAARERMYALAATEPAP